MCCKQERLERLILPTSIVVFVALLIALVVMIGCGADRSGEIVNAARIRYVQDDQGLCYALMVPAPTRLYVALATVPCDKVANRLHTRTIPTYTKDEP